MKLTIQIQILPNPEQAESLLTTMRAMNAASSYAAKMGFENKVFGQISIHKLCYYELRAKFGLSAQMAVRAISKSVNAFTINKKVCPEFSPLGAVEYDKQIYRLLNENTVSLQSLSGRIKVPYVFGNYFKDGLQRKLGQSYLVYKNDKFYLYISTEFTEEPPIEVKDWIGVDFGVTNIATCSDGEQFSGEQIERIRKRNQTSRSQYQRAGTKSAKRRLRKLSGRQARFQMITNHTISKKIVRKAKALNSGICIENLTHIRKSIEKTVRKRVRRKISNWSFHQLRSFIEYKAKMQGIPVKVVDPRNTSRTCNKCGHCEKANRKKQKEFKCMSCGYECNADQNASDNLRMLGVTSKLPTKVSA